MRVLFYCHFPDLLLSQRASWLKSLYRLPLDALEEASTGAADLILVNSNFTAGVFGSTFRRLQRGGVVPGVLYPAVPVPPDSALQEAAAAWRRELAPEVVSFIGQHPVLLSINRFERKKGIGLALTALKELQQRSQQQQASDGGGGGGGGAAGSDNHNSSSLDSAPVLVVAGGYDVRLAENREHLQELKQLARELGIEQQVLFVPSFTDRWVGGVDGRLGGRIECCMVGLGMIQERQSVHIFWRDLHGNKPQLASRPPPISLYTHTHAHTPSHRAGSVHCCWRPRVPSSTRPSTSTLASCRSRPWPAGGPWWPATAAARQRACGTARRACWPSPRLLRLQTRLPPSCSPRQPRRWARRRGSTSWTTSQEPRLARRSARTCSSLRHNVCACGGNVGGCVVGVVFLGSRGKESTFLG